MNATLYKYAPQMEIYDSFAAISNARPIVMTAGPANFSSEVLNTDEYGFRATKFGDRWFGLADAAHTPCNVLVGNSTAFGVGATSDATTVASLLATDDRPWLNLATRAHSSWQELVQFLGHRPFIKEIKTIVVLGGMTELAYMLGPKDYDPIFGRGLFDYPPPPRLASEQTDVADDSEIVHQHDAESGEDGEASEATPRRNKDWIETMIAANWKRRDRVANVIRATMMTWRDLERAIGCRLLYVLQPISPLTGGLSSKEEKLIAAADDQDPFHRFATAIETPERLGWYINLLKSLAQESGVRFFDCNSNFPRTGFRYVDQMHLTDFGAAAASAAIRAELAEERTAASL